MKTFHSIEPMPRVVREPRVWLPLALLVPLLAFLARPPRESPREVKDNGAIDESSRPQPSPEAIPRTAPPCSSSASPPDDREMQDHPLLRGFRGDTHWIHRREGHVGEPYWPQGRSGVTLDPGVDLGQVSPWFVEVAYGDQLSRRQRRAIDRAMGIRGEKAELLLRRSAILRSVRISRSRAAEVFPHLLLPYWRELRERFPMIEPETVPHQVQTALLSLAYNRGPWNPEMADLREPLESRDWVAVSQLIRAMQQDHPLHGIRLRRRFEGLLISQNLIQTGGGPPCPPSRS